ncbi:hypothetical protein HYE59_07525 [Aggregatibacter actinomycetemcomitans]|uniref:hypothetical protein n=1 Tax=Aggregatibacter actinomycetemcomitans TaxID=714 RepID=UPI00197C8D61|nr:hypothetical protein [Aggregatibacter actinomycetemcomitans]MBN6077382.1 hypothetical protein [Aggregatibacter actinomycetemcomitans]
MAKIIIELDNGEKFTPDEVDWFIVYHDYSAKIVFKQAFNNIGVIPQTSASRKDMLDIALRAQDLANLLERFMHEK